MTKSYLARFDEFHEQATKVTGLTDFGPSDYVAPMKLLLADYDRYGSFTAVGEIISSGAMVTLLVARLFAQKGFKEYPQFASAPIEKPIIILGMPRTGSTQLHRILAQTPTLQHLTPWLGNTPMPRPPRETWESNPWYQMTKQGLDAFWEIFPDVKPMHPMVVDEPDECRFAYECTFWSPALCFSGPLEGLYAKWVANTKPRYAYQHYRKVLGLIAGGDKRRWVLKDPTSHSWAPEQLLETFPDAYYVYTHRDPVKALVSVADMMYPTRFTRMAYLTRAQNGREQLNFWAPAVEKLDAALSKLPASRIVDVHMNELHSDPVRVAETIFRHFDIPVTEADKRAWQQYVDADPRGGHGEHRCGPEDVGLTPHEIYAALPNYYAGYLRRYGVN